MDGTSETESSPASKPPPEVNPGNEQDGSVADPELWLEEHGNVLYKFAYLQVRDSHIAEDLVQETLLNAIAAFANFRSESSIRTWLFAILRNEIHRHLRVKRSQDHLVADSDQRESAFLDRLLSPKISGPQFASAVEREEFWDVVQQCYEHLPKHLLDTFLYRLANSDEKMENLSRELNIKQSNLSVRLFRARLMLRDCIERKWTNEN